MQGFCETLSLVIVLLSVVWGKLEDYEFQDVDPPVQPKPQLSLAETLIRNLQKKGYGGDDDESPKPRVNKHLFKSETLVTNRITLYPSDSVKALCRCWESKKFPFCDGAHRAHNERNKDNIGPVLINCMPPEMNAYINETKRSEETKESEESKQEEDK